MVLITHYLQLLCVAGKETQKDVQDEPLPREARWLLKVSENQGPHDWPEKERGGALKLREVRRRNEDLLIWKNVRLSLTSVTQYRLGL